MNNPLRTVLQYKWTERLKKRKMVVQSCLRGRVDVLGLSKIHPFGQGLSKCIKRNDDMRKGMIGAAVWTGLGVTYKGNSKVVQF